MTGRISILSRAALLAAFALAPILTAYRVNAVDTPWHVKTGQWIIAHRAVPRVDFFSFTRAGAEWIDAQWLFQVIAAAAHGLAGPAGLTLLTMLLATALLGLLALSARPRPPAHLLAPALLLILFAANPRLVCRPELLTAALLAALIFCVERARARTVWLWPAAAAQLLLVNVEGLWPLGVALAAALTLDVFRSPERPAGRSRPAWLGFLGFICLAGFLQPYGLRGFWFPLRLLYEVAAPGAVHKQVIAEFQPLLAAPWIAGTAVPFLVLAAAALVLAPLRGRERPALLCLTLALIGLGLLARRNVGVASVVAGFFVLSRLEALAEKFPALCSPRAVAGAGLAVMAAAAVIAALALTQNPRDFDDTLREPGFGWSRRAYPIAAAEFLQKSGYRGRVINNEGAGGWLIYAGWPGWEVFADTRLEVGGEAALAGYREFFADPAGAARRAEEWGAGAMVFRYRTPEMRAFAAGLRGQDRFAVVFDDGRDLVLIRR